jgi:hypothetical protein
MDNDSSDLNDFEGVVVEEGAGRRFLKGAVAAEMMGRGGGRNQGGTGAHGARGGNRAGGGGGRGGAGGEEGGQWMRETEGARGGRGGRGRRGEMGGGRGREGAAVEDTPRGAEDSDDHIYHLPNDDDQQYQNTNVNRAPVENDDDIQTTTTESMYNSSDYDDAGKALQL